MLNKIMILVFIVIAIIQINRGNIPMFVLALVLILVEGMESAAEIIAGGKK